MATGTGLGTQSGMYMNFVNTVKSHLQKKKNTLPCSLQELEYLVRVALDREVQAVSIIKPKPKSCVILQVQLLCINWLLNITTLKKY